MNITFQSNVITIDMIQCYHVGMRFDVIEGLPLVKPLIGLSNGASTCIRMRPAAITVRDIDAYFPSAIRHESYLACLSF